jgi:predicted DNA-binding WGR domain protein
VGWRLSCQDDKSDKYYLVVVFNNVLIFLWGPTGKIGQAQLITPDNPREIAAQAEAQTRKKLSQSQPYRPECSPRQFEIDQDIAARLFLAAKTAAENKQAYAGVTKQKIDYSWTEAVVQSFDKVAHNPRAALGRGQAYRGWYSETYREAAHAGQDLDFEVPKYIQAMWELAH